MQNRPRYDTIESKIERSLNRSQNIIKTDCIIEILKTNELQHLVHITQNVIPCHNADFTYSIRIK